MMRVGDVLPPALRRRLVAWARSGGADWEEARQPGYGIRHALRGRIPWPENGTADALPAPEALLDWPVGGRPVLRLGYVLHLLPFAEACAVACACACACRTVWLAEFVPAERNLGLAAACAARLLPGLRPWGSASAAGRDWLAHGGLEGCLYGAGLRCLSRRTLLGGAALLAHCERILPEADARMTANVPASEASWRQRADRPKPGGKAAFFHETTDRKRSIR